MNPFSNRMAGNSWVVPVSLLSMVLGFMMTAAWVTKENRKPRMELAGASQQDRVGMGTIDIQERYDQISSEVAKLRADKTKLEKALGEKNGSSRLLNDSLQEAKTLACLTDVEGPGVLVTLKDSVKPVQGMGSDQAIHDFDLLRVVNELWNAGAEAISVNGHRVATGTSFRCVGSVIMVDNIRVAPPLQIRAIGDAQTLVGALGLPLGVLSEIRSADASMATVEPVRQMRLPAFTGSTSRKYGAVPKDAQ